MDVIINGATEVHTGEPSVTDVLATRGHDPQTVVVERNGEIIPRNAFSQTLLHQGDRLEIVQFVGGG